MPKPEYRTKKQVLERAREAIGIPLRCIDKTNRLKTGKGAVGSILEESWFGYKINNTSEPDFPQARVELKTNPFIRTRKGIRAKERLVCNMIDYMEEHKKTFFTSSFWQKCETILLMSYEYKDDSDKGDITIDEATLFCFPEKDLVVIKSDWKKIIEKIREGSAHTISEGDTLYLGACTKGNTSSTTRKQPFSKIPAKQRAYSLKQSYMTEILNSYIFSEKINESIIKDPALIENTSLESYIIEKAAPYIGRTQESLSKEFKIKTNAKNVNELLLARMLGINGKVSASDEFKKANIVPKTVRINKNGSITESMSFPAFDFKKIVSEDWDTCEFKNMLEQTKFLFVVFRFQKDDSLVFDDLIFWNLPESALDEVKKVWEKTVAVLKEGVKIWNSGKRNFNNLPNASDNSVCHVRPHAKDSHDTLELPDGRKMTKQSFWLNNTYIRAQLEKHQIFDDQRKIESLFFEIEHDRVASSGKKTDTAESIAMDPNNVIDLQRKKARLQHDQE
ncbi:MAG: Sau3AI family type II restriction endonuclease [Candidatus Gracilibacteria bacterium]|nr:Sau3AI family type II restriction endonuclease [Candidatus Gracilibacteria bacterium]